MSYRRKNSSDSRVFYQWLDYSFEDILAAKALASNKDCYKLCLFHCHQCIEKSLKAYILFKSERLTDGHNLTFLCKQAMKLNDKFADYLDESAHLNKCYIQTRYPSDFLFEVSEKQVEKAFEMADSMFTFICNELETQFL